jgi:long-chain acyl-CoA synthetase
MSHRNLFSAAISMHGILGVNMSTEDAAISYLPYPHIFENGLTCLYILSGVKIGYYQGDPLKLTEDCAALQPAFFPSVPRLFNRIYSKIKERMDSLPGCKGWLA